ncbi:MAG: hypothetical protein Fur0021_02410 [Candidatus Promineifilaceae bacterium]
MATEHALEEKVRSRPRPKQEESLHALPLSPPTREELAGPLTPDTLNRLHQTVGNATVQRMLAQRSGSGPTELDDQTASAITSRLGQGSALDAQMSNKAGSAMGTDFSQVNVHTGTDADQLSRQLGAKAFTVGSDIFFRDGAYSPHSHEGQHLLAHELTHVVQQGGSAPGVQGKMSVNDPQDHYEAEADRVADQVMNQPESAPAEGLQMQEEQEEELLQMQELEEEEEML